MFLLHLDFLQFILMFFSNFDFPHHQFFSFHLFTLNSLSFGLSNANVVFPVGAFYLFDRCRLLSCLPVHSNHLDFKNLSTSGPIRKTINIRPFKGLVWITYIFLNSFFLKNNSSISTLCVVGHIHDNGTQISYV